MAQFGHNQAVALPSNMVEPFTNELSQISSLKYLGWVIISDNAKSILNSYISVEVPDDTKMDKFKNIQHTWDDYYQNQQ